jgi:hypothetical protein
LFRKKSGEDTLKVDRSYRFKPFPKLRERIPFKRTFTEQEFEALSNAPLPETMDRRWHSVVKGEWLHLIRTWTGFCIFKFRVRTESPHDVIETWASRDRGQYNHPRPEEEIKMMNAAIEAIVRETRQD